MLLGDAVPSSGDSSRPRGPADEEAGASAWASRNAFSPLIERARDGDRSALEMLFVALQPEIQTTVESLVQGHRHRRISTVDVCQVVALRVLLHLDRIGAKDNATFRRWLRSVALHCLQSRWRELVTVKRGSDKEILWSELDEAQRAELGRARYAQATSIPEGADLHQFEQRLPHCLKQLVEPERLLVHLVFVEGMSIRSVAKRLKRDEATVRRRLARALGALVLALAQYGHEK